MSITLFDGLLIGLMLISGILAMIRGFSREVLSVGSWVAAAFAAFFFYKSLSPFVARWSCLCNSAESARVVSRLLSHACGVEAVLLCSSLIGSPGSRLLTSVHGADLAADSAPSSQWPCFPANSRPAVRQCRCGQRTQWRAGRRHLTRDM